MGRTSGARNRVISFVPLSNRIPCTQHVSRCLVVQRPDRSKYIFPPFIFRADKALNSTESAKRQHGGEKKRARRGRRVQTEAFSATNIERMSVFLPGRIVQTNERNYASDSQLGKVFRRVQIFFFLLAGWSIIALALTCYERQ